MGRDAKQKHPSTKLRAGPSTGLVRRGSPQAGQAAEKKHGWHRFRRRNEESRKAGTAKKSINRKGTKDAKLKIGKGRRQMDSSDGLSTAEP